MDNMDSTNDVLFRKDEAVAVITFNRPGVYNSLTRPMILHLHALLDEVMSDPSIRALVITGSGKAFCAGQDLSEVVQAQEAGEPMDFEQVVSELYAPLVLKIREVDKPVIAAVNGTAAGAGANLALACDLVVAKRSATFIQAFSKIGLVPDSGGTFFLPRLVGSQHAAAMMFLGDPVSASEAKDMGLIYTFYEDEAFEQAVDALAQRLAVMPTRGLAYTKQLLSQSSYSSLEEQLKSEGSFQKLAGQTADYAEGVQAFLEKRSPIFKGK